MAPPDTNTLPPTRSILVTDSGLGGLSVFNDIANRLVQAGPWQRVKLVYFNAWPAPHRGYNHFDTQAKRTRVFNNALNAMADFKPDMILIACNTLSVIYPHTPFCRSSPIRVEGIVNHGVQLIHENLTANPESMVVILGTPTTIAAKSHENELVRLGISKDRIINIKCTNLAGWIEREPFSQTVNEMIREFVRQTASEIGNHRGDVFAALCCTHFGYRQNLFKQAFAEFVRAKVMILDPNIRMAQQVFETGDASRSVPTRIDMQIVSKAVWSGEQVKAYLQLLPNISAAAKDALTHYTLDPELFSVE